MWTIRAKLAIIMILTLAPPMAVLSLVTTRLMRTALERQANVTLDYVTAQNNATITRDLASLRALMAQRTERLQHAVAAALAEGAVGDLIAQGRYGPAGTRLMSALSPSGASMITAVSRDGRTVARATNPALHGDLALWNHAPTAEGYVSDLRAAVAAAFTGVSTKGVVILSPRTLRAEQVTAATAIPHLTTPLDRLSDQAWILMASGQRPEKRGLTIAAVVPVPDSRGRIQGAAVAAWLANRDPSIELAYRRETQHLMAVCLGEVVVAGDLPTTGRSVLGEILDPAFTGPILRQGQQGSIGRLGSTGVQLNAVAGALRDVSGATVGLLVAASPVTELQQQVDHLQADAARLESRSLLTLLLWLCVGAAIALIAAMLAARGITQPIRQLQEGARRIGDGDFSHRLRVHSRDELEELAAEFNQMAEHLEGARDQERHALIGRMASGIAHDIQNALTVIRGSAPLLAREDLPADQREEFSAMVVDSVEQIADMARDLVEFARGEEARLQLQAMSVDEYLGRLRSRLERDLRQSQIRVVFDLNCARRVRIDPARMNRVILNLVANARDAIDAVASPSSEARASRPVRTGENGGAPRGVLTISSHCERGYAEIRCADTGPGIPPEIEGRLFQPFASFGKSYGTGLGLVICKQIVEAHGGTIEARSVRRSDRSARSGATFVIRLPLAENG